MDEALAERVSELKDDLLDVMVVRHGVELPDLLKAAGCCGSSSTSDCGSDGCGPKMVLGLTLPDMTC